MCVEDIDDVIVCGVCMWVRIQQVYARSNNTLSVSVYSKKKKKNGKRKAREPFSV